MGQGGEIRLAEGRLSMADPSAAPAAAADEIPPDTDPAIRTIAMPADTNPHGDIFGGWLLCQMDLAGASVAVRRAGGRVVTVAITAMAFHRPVCVGDQVSCYGSVDKIGTTSIAIKVESWALRGTGTTPIKVTEGLFTYVRVGPDGHPQPIAAQ
jgi:acyl-CoA thioesterase YciA